ncbi:hypothetical protein [Streptomyces ortus]|uniref:Uncharacterized protein n=1 Tax=Streptomyces ortus TaxID=2867268 RepID=A0ABT3V2E1_9ACTN|nr:hypothetical protein [Streptomyces ortus]MCX4232815.1 hypothetical protein [Streptomyces ortus]
MPENDNPDVDDVEDVEDQDVEETDDDVEDEEDEWTPPSKEEWTKLSNAAKARKRERDAAKRELATLKNGKDEEDEDDNEAKKWRSTAARNSAATALSAAGFPGTAKQARLLTRLLDLNSAEPDGNGDFDFGDEIEELKEEFPSLFKELGEPRRRAPKVTTSDRGRTAGGGNRDRASARLLKQAGIHL